MSRRKSSRCRDIGSLGRSSIAPYIDGEAAMVRHERRKVTNINHVDELKKWCDSNGWDFRLRNDGHHWIFEKSKMIVEWWPSSAKLVKNKDWGRGLHCHDYLKVISYLKGLDSSSA